MSAAPTGVRSIRFVRSILGLLMLVAVAACDGTSRPGLSPPSAAAADPSTPSFFSAEFSDTPSGMLPLGWGDVLSIRDTGLLVLSTSEGEPIASMRIPETRQQESEHRIARLGSQVLILARRRGADVVRARLAFDRWGAPISVPRESLSPLWKVASKSWVVDFGDLVDSHLAVPIAGALSPEFERRHPDEDLRYLLRLDGYLDGVANREVTWSGAEVRLDRYEDGSAQLIGMIDLNSVDGARVSRDLRRSEFAGPFRLSVLLTAIDDEGTPGRYSIGEGSVIVRVADPRHRVELRSPEGAAFRVGSGGNGKTSAMGAGGAVNYLHRWRSGSTGSLDRPSAGSSFLMELQPISP